MTDLREAIAALLANSDAETSDEYALADAVIDLFKEHGWVELDPDQTLPHDLIEFPIAEWDRPRIEYNNDFLAHHLRVDKWRKVKDETH